MVRRDRKGESKKDRETYDQKVNPVINIRVSAWTRAALRGLVDDGTYKTLGQAADRVVKTALAGDGEQQVETVPRSTEDLEDYFPILANDLPEGIFGQLNKIDKYLTVLVAFFSELNDLVAGDLAGCNPERVKRFRVSNIGVEAVGVGQGRYLLSERLRYWKRVIRQAEDVYHPHAKQSDGLLGRELFAAPRQSEVLQRIRHEDNDSLVQSTRDIDADFMGHAERLSMTPARFVRMIARSQERELVEVVDELLSSLNIIDNSPVNNSDLQQLQLPDVIEGDIINE